MKTLQKSTENPINTVRLDGGLMTNKRIAHALIKAAFGWPDDYGHNLDALYDLLTAEGEIKVIITRPAVLVRMLGLYGLQMLAVFRQASLENPLLHLILLRR